MAVQFPTVHASAVLVGARAVLIRGPSGSGKSRLALDLIETAQAGTMLFAKLVADDRLSLEPAAGRLLTYPAAALAGLIEVRGLGLLRLDFEASAVVGFVVDLAAADAERLPPQEKRQVEIEGIKLPRIAIAAGMAALPGVLAFITSSQNERI